MNYSTAKTILHLYRKKQKKAGKKIKEENRCQYKKITQIEENNLEVIVTQGGKIMQKNKESLLVKPICKGRSQEEELKYMNYQYQLKLMLSQYKTIQNQPVATNLTQKAEIKPSQILFNPNNKINNFSLKNCDTNCNVKKNVIIIKAVEDKRLTV